MKYEFYYEQLQQLFSDVAAIPDDEIAQAILAPRGVGTFDNEVDKLLARDRHLVMYRIARLAGLGMAQSLNAIRRVQLPGSVEPRATRVLPDGPVWCAQCGSDDVTVEVLSRWNEDVGEYQITTEQTPLFQCSECGHVSVTAGVVGDQV